MVRSRIAILAVAGAVAVLAAGWYAVGPFASAGIGIGIGTGTGTGTADGAGDGHGPRFRAVGADRGFDYEASRIGTFGNGRAGVYVSDVDRNGWPDVLALGGNEPALFENEDGEFERSDALSAIETTVKGALFFDYDNDGWEDLLLLPLNGSATFLENDDGRFRRRDVGLDADMHVAIGASAADFDRDGCLDLFVHQNGNWQHGVPARSLSSPSSDQSVENGTGNPNLLFDGDCGSFERVDDAGIAGHRWSLATSFVDLTGDGYPDVHVGNDFASDVLYVNRGDGTFDRRELPDTDRHAMASEVADVNGDGRLDVFVTNVHFDKRTWMQETMPSMDNTGNNLLINRGGGRFASRERAYGVRDGGWGWAAALADLDNDGDRDLVHATKSYRADTDSDGARESVATTPRIWERTGDNFTRLNGSAVGFETSSGRGLARLDFDRDGDLDLVVANHAGAYELYENRHAGAGAGGNWLQVDLRSNGSPALGTEVTVTTAAGNQTRTYHARADFLSQDSRTLHFGLGSEDAATLRVVWPDGTERLLTDVPANRRLVLSPGGPVETASARRELGGSWPGL